MHGMEGIKREREERWKGRKERREEGREGRKEGQEIEFKHQRSKQPCPCKEASIKTLKDGVPGWGASGDWGAQGALMLHAPPHINLYHLAIPGLHSL